MASWLQNIGAGVASVAARLTGNDRWLRGSRTGYRSKTTAGVHITPDNATSISTVWACVRYISQTVAITPWLVMQQTATGPQRAFGNSVNRIIGRRPNPEWSSFQFRETLTHWALIWGNGYAEIERDQADRPFNLWPIHPDRVMVCRAIDDTVDDHGDAIAAGAIYYEVNGGQGTVTLAARNMYHLRGFGEGPVGVSIIHYAAESIGWAKAAQLFGAAFFGNGATVAGVVLNKKALSPDALEVQRAEFDRLYGGVRKAHRTAHLDASADFKAVGIDPDKAQFLQTNQYLVTEICRWFGVPPHKVASLDRATFTNIESQSIEVIGDCILPWVKRHEDEADYKLFGQNRQNLYSKMMLLALLRGDSTARSAYYQIMRNMGAFSVNVILEMEDMPTIGPEGDKRVMQTQYTTLDKIGDDAADTPATDPVPDVLDPDEGEDDPEETAAALEIVRLFAEVMANAA